MAVFSIVIIFIIAIISYKKHFNGLFYFAICAILIISLTGLLSFAFIVIGHNYHDTKTLVKEHGQATFEQFLEYNAEYNLDELFDKSESKEELELNYISDTYIKFNGKYMLFNFINYIQYRKWYYNERREWLKRKRQQNVVKW